MSEKMYYIKVYVGSKTWQRATGEVEKSYAKVQVTPGFVKKVVGMSEGRVYFNFKGNGEVTLDYSSGFVNAKSALELEIEKFAAEWILRGLVDEDGETIKDPLREDFTGLEVFSEALKKCEEREWRKQLRNNTEEIYKKFGEQLRTNEAKNKLYEEYNKALDRAAMDRMNELYIENALAAVFDEIKELDNIAYIEKLEKRVKELEDERNELRQEIWELEEKLEQYEEDGEDDC